MRHYLYLEDKRIAYVCGSFKGGVFALRAARTVEFARAGDVEEAAAFLRSMGLAGKRVVAAVGGGDIILREMRLPAASAPVTRGMIRNEIAYFRKTAAATAADMDLLERSSGGKEQHLLAYAAERERLVQRLLPLKEAGISCSRLRALPDCVAKFAFSMGAGERAAVVAAMEPNQLRLYLVKAGHCLLNRNLRLNVSRFCEAGANALLYEEIADQISKMIQFCEARTEADSVEQVMLLPGSLGDAKAAAAAVGHILKVPCACVEPEIRICGKMEPDSPDIHFSALALCCADRPGKGLCTVDLLAAERGLARPRPNRLPETFGARCLFFAAANALAVAGIWCYLEAGTSLARQKSAEISAFLSADEGAAAYRELMARRQQLAVNSAARSRLRETEQAVWGMKCLTMEDYEVLERCMVPGMAIESAVYSADTGYLSLKLTIPNGAEAPGYVERVRESGYFPEVEYSAWGYSPDDPEGQEFYLEMRIGLTGKEGRQNASQ